MRLVVLAAAAAAAVGIILVGAVPNSTYATGVGTALEQPLPFSHKHHSGELGIDCRYCHTSVERLASAGLPPTHTCMTCHSQIWNKSPMLAPVRDSLAQDTPIEWQRVNRLPDYVYFNHSIHVTKGIGCSTCHGNLTKMQLTWRAQPFTMNWCLSCHRHPEANVRTPGEVWDMDWHPPRNQATLGPKLVAQYGIHGGARLTDCSICHR